LTPELERKIKQSIRIVHDYPKKGVSFKDLTTLWKDPSLLRKTTEALAHYWEGRRLDKIVGIEARGFIVGAALAYRLGIGFVPARKAGKLPSKTVRVSYELEYGKHSLEIHSDGVSKGDKVLIVDDLLATGGTARAVLKLVQKLGGTVEGFAFVAELDYLKGRRKLSGYEIQSLARYETED
jgi:adenine phosphoribosyltransferase